MDEEYYDFFANPEDDSSYFSGEIYQPDFQADSSWNDFINQGGYDPNSQLINVGDYLRDMGQNSGFMPSDFDSSMSGINGDFLQNLSFSPGGYGSSSFSDIPFGSELTTGGTYGGPEFGGISVPNELAPNDLVLRTALGGQDTSMQEANDSVMSMPGAQSAGAGQVTLPDGTTMDKEVAERLMLRSSAPKAMSYSPEALHSGLYGAFPVGAFSDDPRTRPSQSYLDQNGDIVGLTYGTDVPADFQNPYEYRMSGDEAFIRDLRNGDVEGWLGENGPQYYQDERIANNLAAGRPSLYGVQRPDSPGGGGAASAGYRAPGASGSTQSNQSAAQRSGISGKTQEQAKKDSTSTAKDSMGILNMLAQAANLFGGDKIGPEDKRKYAAANATNWAGPKRYAQGGLAQFNRLSLADGGSVKDKLMELWRLYGLSSAAPTTEYRRPEHDSKRDPAARDLITDNPGLMQDAGRAMTGRGRQLEDLERQAVGMADGGYLSPSLVRHASGGQADAIPARLAGGEFVIPSDVVSHLGDGNTDAGAAQLNKLMSGVRRQKGQPNRLPPRAKSPLEYMKGR